MRAAARFGLQNRCAAGRNEFWCVGGGSLGADSPRSGGGLDGRLRKLLLWRPGKCQPGAAAGCQRLVRDPCLEPPARGACRLDHPCRRHSGGEFGGAGRFAGGRRSPVAAPRARLWSVVSAGRGVSAGRRRSGLHHGNVAEGLGVRQLGLQLGKIELELFHHHGRQGLKHVLGIGNLVR